MGIKSDLRELVTEEQFRMLYPSIRKIPNLRIVHANKLNDAEGFIKEFRAGTLYSTFTCLLSGAQVSLGVDIRIPRYNTTIILANGFETNNYNPLTVLLIYKGE